MSLDTVEFVIAVEEAFGLAIPNEDAQELVTPGHLLRYLEQRLVTGQSAHLEQRAFYALRRAGTRALGINRTVFRPAALWDEVLPARRRRRVWKSLGQQLGSPAWPRMWPWGSIAGGHRTVGDTARYLAIYAPATLKAPDEAWGRQQIEATITGLLCDQLGIERFEWNHRFVEDLGLD